ncbi:DNRLRE domain-containing protein [Methanosarcina sp. KYL-1]|uniref:disaggregatase related repeat-containing protein n=1 Tax=Methanosarcina sp. KYL-1 TaxID=2602068 RepID=UPI002100CC22|nr:disaggregatase related repeat-containing protein [Methanosarcina sp. KYL-1]MCQ1535233.1 DNRLRE domain-containing protein [Methanosarcina sp. KYL-1]
MLKRKLGALFLLTSLLLTGIPTTLAAPAAPIVYVAGDGSGDFNCDGKDDHVQINAALKFVADNPQFTTVYLKGPFTYVIDSTLLIGDNTILEGDSDACIKLADEAGWATLVPLIKNRDSAGNDHITIRGFEINGNSEKQMSLGSSRLGRGYYNLMHFTKSSDITVENMYLHHGCGDGLKVENVDNVNFIDNTVYQLGHDALYCIYSKNIVAANNDIFTRTNSALRLTNSNNAKLHDNLIHSEYKLSSGSSTGPGIEIQKTNGYTMGDIEVFDNVLHTLNGAGIWMFGYDNDNVKRGSDVYIHHNIFKNVGQYWVDTGYSNAGIIISQFDNTRIENNVFDNGGHAGIKFWKYSSQYQMSGTFTATVRNNVVLNHDDHEAAGIWVQDTASGKYAIKSENNCFYNNAGGSYLGPGITRSNDILTDPLFVNPSKNDYHLKSKSGHWDGKTWAADTVSSPCIDGGYTSSDYSNEPEDNGNRINIGRYGNTKYASLSGSSGTIPANNAPVMDSITSQTVEEGSTLTFTVKATDADGDSLTYSASNLPVGANLNSESGSFTWTPTEGQAGTYKVTFTTSDGKLSDSKEATITVVVSGENPVPNEEIYDNRLREASPDAVIGDNNYIDIGEISGKGRYRDVLWFDLSAYSDAETIDKATLSLFWYYPKSNVRPEDTIVEIYRPEEWNPNYVSWNNRDLNNPWDNAGGDWYDKNNISQGSTPYATITFNGSDFADDGYHELDVTDLVKEYVSGEYENAGFLIKDRSESGNYIAFYSSDYEIEGCKPKLDITQKKITEPVTLSDLQDNRLREASPDTVFKDLRYIDLGGRDKVGAYRGLLLFNLSEYDSAETIEKANLSLFWYYPAGTERPEDTIVEIYRPETWNPDSVTWNNRDLNKPWENAGGDWFDKDGVSQGSAPYATLTLKGSDVPGNGYYELDVTDLMKEYVSGKYENTGFLIKARNESGNYIAFYSSDCGIEGCTPKLNITQKPVSEPVVLSDLLDSRLREGSPNTAFKDVRYIDLGGRDGVGAYRDLLLFDLSEYDSEKTLEKATLSLFWYYPAGIERPEDTIVEIYRPKVWNPDYVTWNNWDLNNPWDHAGGDWFDKNNVAQGSTPYATLTLNGSEAPDNSYHELDVTDLVNEYVSGKYENTGFLIKARIESKNYVAFYSSDYEDENQRPKLILEKA